MKIKGQDYPILECDLSRKAILEPEPQFKTDGQDRTVLCFFRDILDKNIENGLLKPVGNLVSEIGPNPVYEMQHEGKHLMVVHPGVGAPLAACFLEEMIALGAKKIIACGGCGVLDSSIDAGHPMIVEAAVRDEGTSYHYLPAGRETTPHPDAILAIEETFQAHHLPVQKIKTWTTDAIYRETAEKRDCRMTEGCKVVEMEAAAFFAVAHFRGVKMGQILYGGDLVIPEGWDARDWIGRISSRELLFRLAVEAVLKMD